MKLPQPRSCCFLFSLKTGAFLIFALNEVISFFGLIAWLSTLRILTSHGGRLPNAVRGHISAGILATLAQAVVGFVLYIGLRKNDLRYMRWFLVSGSVVLGLNMLSAAMSASFTPWSLIYPLVGVPLQTYFLLVVRGAYREMADEAETEAAGQRQPWDTESGISSVS